MSTAQATLPVRRTTPREGVPAGYAALAGMAAAVLALGVAELLAALVPGMSSLVLAIGDAVIELQPPGAKDLFVQVFGTNDKLALNILVVGATLAIAAGLGIAARRRPLIAQVGIAVLSVTGFAASLVAGSSAPLFAAIGAAIAAVVGIKALEWLLGLAGSSDGTTVTGGSSATVAEIREAGTGPSRRSFLVGAGLLTAAGAVAGGIGRSLLDARAADVADAEVAIPAPGEPAAPIPAGAELAVPGITPLVVPNKAFYRIDTALLVPAVDLGDWRLTVTGMVERETTFTFEELVALPLVERYVTIACVSNEVGGDLIGNAKWTGVRLTEVLDMAGVLPGATQIVPRSVDGWTAGFPTEWVTGEERDALIAVRMNGEPLPVEHGFPARLIVPGLYGYVSATKWLSEIELTTLEGFDAYWVPRGWAKEAPILTQSRIDVPRNGASVSAGRVAVAGVAWAPERGISAVEVAIDDGPWQAATLATAISDQTWVQWRFDWSATSGRHTIAVRATDGTGEIQTDQRTRPDPDGARGHHTIEVSVD